MSPFRLPNVSDRARELFAMMGGGYALFVPKDGSNPQLIAFWRPVAGYPADEREVLNLPGDTKETMQELLSIRVICLWDNRERTNWLCGWSEFDLPGDKGKLYRCTQ